MGQKVSPHGLRVGINKNWDSRWFAGKDKIAEYKRRPQGKSILEKRISSS